MAGAKVNAYTLGDSDPFALTSLMESSVWQRKGYTGLSLTNYDNTTVPAIGAGSVIEVGGSLYKFATEEAISTTDPDTAGAVADGVVYIRVIPAGSSITAVFTATAPTWDDSKGGFYTSNDRAIGKCVKATAAYTSKLVYSAGLFSNYAHDKFDHINVYSNASKSSSGVMTFNTEIHDALGNFNTSTYTFTATEDGYYQVYAQYEVQTAFAGSVEIRKNSTRVAWNDRRNNTTEGTHNVTTTLHLSAGDTIDGFISRTSGGIDALSSFQTYMTIDRIK